MGNPVKGLTFDAVRESCMSRQRSLPTQFSTGEFTKAGCRVASVARHPSSVPDRQPDSPVGVVCRAEGSRETAENFVSGGLPKPMSRRTRRADIIHMQRTLQDSCRGKGWQGKKKIKFNCAIQKESIFLPLIPSHGDAAACQTGSVALECDSSPPTSGFRTILDIQWHSN